MKYKKTLAELEKVAIKWWPKSLEETVASASVIPKLIETHEKFISLLKLSGDRPEQIFDVLKSSSLPANILVKHLLVLTDFGGEPLKRLGSEFEVIFPTPVKGAQHVLDYVFKGESHRYKFQSLPQKGLSNNKLGVDGKAIIKARPLDALLQDVAMLLLYGATSPSAHLASLDRCDLGSMLGNDALIETHIRQKYLHVSRITTGASANSLGQIAQIHVRDHLIQQLGKGYEVKSNGKIRLQGYDSKDGMPFDVVVSRKNKMVGIEVSFQVTSNSVIERKAAQAENRRNLMRHEGHFIAYVLDGAGNFSRQSALGVLCQSSDCTVSFAESELYVLADFIKGKLDDPLR